MLSCKNLESDHNKYFFSSLPWSKIWCKPDYGEGRKRVNPSWSAWSIKLVFAEMMKDAGTSLYWFMMASYLQEWDLSVDLVLKDRKLSSKVLVAVIGAGLKWDLQRKRTQLLWKNWQHLCNHTCKMTSKGLRVLLSFKQKLMELQNKTVTEFLMKSIPVLLF